MHSCKQIVLRAALIAAFAAPTLTSLAVPPPRTFVASNGNDTNACSRTAPCRTFGAAVAAVATGGEVIVLDTGGYGPVTITKSVSLIAPDSVYAGVTVPNATDGVLLSTASPNDVVLIRGLTFTSTGNGDGVGTTASCRLTVEKCSFSNFSGLAIAMGQGPGPMVVRNCTVKDGSSGVYFRSSTTPVIGAVEECKFHNLTGTAVAAGDGSQVVVRDTSAYNCAFGYTASAGTDGRNAELTVERCYAGFCRFLGAGAGLAATGLEASGAGSALIRVSNSTIVDCDNGFKENIGASVQSRSNNTLEGNTNNNLFDNLYNVK